MPVDVTKLSDEELRALTEGDVSKLSDETLRELSAGSPSDIGSTVQRFLETGAPLAGALVGGTIGATTPLGPIGAGIGAGLGAAAGQQITEITRPFLTGEPAEPVAGALRSLETGALSAVGEALVPGVGKTLPFFRRSVTAGARQAQQVLKSVGKSLTLAQLTENRFLDIIENVTEASLFGGGRFAAFKESAKEGFKEISDRFVDQVGTRFGATEVGRLLTNSREHAIEMFKQARKVLYKQVDDLSKGTFVDTDRVVRDINAMKNRRAVERALSAADVDVDDLLRFPTASGRLTNQTTFQSAQEARSRLLRIARRQPTSADDEAVVGMAGRMAKLVDDSLEASGQQLNPEALAAFRTANRFNREGMGRLENDLVRSIARRLDKEPGRVVGTLLQPNRPDLLRTVKAATVDKPTTFERLQEKFATHLIESSATTEGRVMGTAGLRRLKQLGPEVLDEAFGPQRRHALTEFFRVAETIQKKGPTGIGRIAIQLTQVGAGMELLFNPVETLTGLPTGKPAVLLVFGPAVLGRIMTNPTAIRVLTEGMKAGPRTAQFFRAMNQLAATTLRPEEFKRPVRPEPVQVPPSLGRTRDRPAAMTPGRR